MTVRLELGGGDSPRPGFVNVDLRAAPGVDYVRDFERLVTSSASATNPWPGPDHPAWLPFPDDGVVEVYSAHCFEHIDPVYGLLHETARVCRVGAAVEIRVPSWLSQMAHCYGHKVAISPVQVRHWCSDFPDYWWAGCKKRFAHQRTEYVRGEWFDEARGLFPHMTDEQVMRFMPNACHEVRYFFQVVRHDG